MNTFVWQFMKNNVYLKTSQEYTNCIDTNNTILLKNKAFLNYIYNFYICYQIFIKL